MVFFFDGFYVMCATAFTALQLSSPVIVTRGNKIVLIVVIETIGVLETINVSPRKICLFLDFVTEIHTYS